MSTVEEVSQAKFDFEDKLLHLISEFESDHKMLITSINIDRVHIRNPDNGSEQRILSGISVEVTLP